MGLALQAATDSLKVRELPASKRHISGVIFVVSPSSPHKYLFVLPLQQCSQSMWANGAVQVRVKLLNDKTQSFAPGVFR